MNIYLDDNRPCPDNFELAETLSEFKELVRRYKDDLGVISLDYDLGGFGTGLDAAKFLVENSFFPRKAEVHSNHPDKDILYYYLKEHMPEGVKVTSVYDVEEK